MSWSTEPDPVPRPGSPQERALSLLRAHSVSPEAARRMKSFVADQQARLKAIDDTAEAADRQAGLNQRPPMPD